VSNYYKKYFGIIYRLLNQLIFDTCKPAPPLRFGKKVLIIFLLSVLENQKPWGFTLFSLKLTYRKETNYNMLLNTCFPNSVHAIFQVACCTRAEAEAWERLPVPRTACWVSALASSLYSSRSSAASLPASTMSTLLKVRVCILQIIKCNVKNISCRNFDGHF